MNYQVFLITEGVHKEGDWLYIPLHEIDKFVTKTTMGAFNLDRDDLWGKDLPFNYQSYYFKCSIKWRTEDNGFACALMCDNRLIGVVWLSDQFINRFNRPD